MAMTMTGLSQKSLVVVVLVSLSAGCTLDAFLFNRTQQDGPYDFAGTSIPADRFSAEGTFIKAADGTRIHLHFVEASGDHSTRAKAAILYCHGNKDHIKHYWDRVEAFYEMGYQLLIFDYRGFGRSGGEPDEPGLYMDGEAALAHLLQQPSVDPGRVAFYSNSLGAAVCIELASRHADQPQALVVAEPFRSIADMVADGAQVSFEPGFVTDHRFANIDKIHKVGAPLFVIHGAEDTYLMPQYGRDLYDKALDPKELWLVPGAGHGEITGAANTARRAQFSDRVTRFLDAHVK